ncbi:hypothetical protein BC937DRAFT_91415 [Endogone sp. FLAS-F59071]|nr:hypothetical protein BC937DRAFT_91415 [Endogone sp. FLAS-F59071]|eukprot:RUS16275.1 hypothetical protein BC937DRAFT_91415 [Endogone sp. FLAS-F59071]
MSVNFDTQLAFHILNGFFEDHSYVKNFEASDADTTIFEALPTGPNEAEYPHLARWYNHIATTQGLNAKAAAASSAGGAAAAEDEDEIDLFGSDDEEVDEEAEKLKAERLAEYAAKKANKPKVTAKSMVTLDVKPWDDETNMEELEKAVRIIKMDGLLWGQSKLVAVGFGIKKLQINLVVEDDKVSIDDLQEQIQSLEEYVQSTDVAAMQKI